MHTTPDRERELAVGNLMPDRNVPYVRSGEQQRKTGRGMRSRFLGYCLSRHSFTADVARSEIASMIASKRESQFDFNYLGSRCSLRDETLLSAVSPDNQVTFRRWASIDRSLRAAQFYAARNFQ